MKGNMKKLAFLMVVATLLALLLVGSAALAGPPLGPLSQISLPERPKAPVNRPLSGIVEMTLVGKRPVFAFEGRKVR